MKFIIILIIIGALIAFGISLYVATRPISSEDTIPSYRSDWLEKSDKVIKDWQAEEKELEQKNKEFCAKQKCERCGKEILKAQSFLNSIEGQWLCRDCYFNKCKEEK